MNEAYKFCVIDSETTGLPPKGPDLPADHPSQPRLAHLAMVFLDLNLEIEATEDWYVLPQGWTIGDDMLEINGLTQRFLLEHGHPIDEVLGRYVEAIDAGYVMAAWNAQFDLKIMRGEIRRVGGDDRFEQTKNICLMRAYKDWRKIFKGYKLSDACTYLDIPYERHHRAPADALAAVEVFRKMRKLGVPIPEPEVHRHKDYEAIKARGV